MKKSDWEFYRLSLPCTIKIISFAYVNTDNISNLVDKVVIGVMPRMLYKYAN